LQGARPPARAAYQAHTLRRRLLGRGHGYEPERRSERLCACGKIDTKALHSLSSPLASPIRPLAVAADDGKLAPEVASEPGEAPAVHLGNELRRSEAAAVTIGPRRAAGRTVGHRGRVARANDSNPALNSEQLIQADG